MLFNSYIFIFLFLPVTLLGYTLLGKNRTLVIYWLTLASWVFYSFWNPVYFPLLLGSIIVNFGLGKLIARRNSKMILIWGIGLNLALIAYYKYSGFFLSMAIPNDSPAFSLASTILPLGISFFTFQQIAYLVDTYKKQTVKHSFSEYALFVSFFPQLIAGPIVQQKDVLPQFHRNKFKLSQRLLFFGLSYFILVLFKKVAVADTFGQFASPLFVQAGAGEALGFIEAWSAALAYTFQLYFDFSAYSDMAIGLALMFGIKLPLNFYSPYKALNISDFWRRWHITLSHFLRDYLYIPLGGNRAGKSRKYFNLITVMLLGGLWHGAGWTFILWGGLHGIYLVINQMWWALRNKFKLPSIPAIISWAITFTSVVFAWVLFRAESMDIAINIWRGMIGANSFTLTLTPHTGLLGLSLLGGFIICLALPNTHQWVIGWTSKKKRIMRKSKHGIKALYERIPIHPLSAITLGGICWGSLLLVQFFKSEFLYFNF